MSDKPMFDVEVEVTKYETVSRAFEVGDTVEFHYTDVSSKTEQTARGAVVGYWGERPVVLDDDWNRTRTSVHRRLFRLDPNRGRVDVINQQYVEEHPNEEGQLALAGRYRKSDDEPRTTTEKWNVGWQKRGHSLGRFQFDVELNNPDRPETKFNGVVVQLGKK